MNTSQIDGILKRIVKPPTRFLGVFAKDQLPEPTTITHFPSCLIANTDKASGKGEHWVAFWFDSPYSCEFFDSYGLSPFDYGFSFSCTSFNSRTLQSLTSSVCGQFCIYYLYSRSRGLSLSHIINSFFSNLGWNDYQVAHFVNKHFGISNASLTSHICQSCGPRVSCRCVSHC